MNLKLGIQLYQNMGTRYVVYRVCHELEKRLGLLKKKHPTDLVFQQAISLLDWRKSKNPFVIPAREHLTFAKTPSDILQHKAERILNGELQYFNAQWLNIGKNYDWVTNPSNGYRYDITKH